jgi:hypothetical protein
MYAVEVLEYFVCSFDPDEAQIQGLIDAFHKVYENRGALAAHENKNCA